MHAADCQLCFCLFRVCKMQHSHDKCQVKASEKVKKPMYYTMLHMQDAVQAPGTDMRWQLQSKQQANTHASTDIRSNLGYDTSTRSSSRPIGAHRPYLVVQTRIRRQCTAAQTQLLRYRQQAYTHAAITEPCMKTVPTIYYHCSSSSNRQARCHTNQTRHLGLCQAGY